MLDYRFLSKQIPNDQNFALIRRNKQIYVDKTDIIYDLAYENKPQFLSRPRRFGKSTIISILKELFTHGVKDFIDENGIKHESYFKGLAIEKLWTEEKEYKVIHLNFASLPNNANLIEQRLKSIGKTRDDKLDLAIETFRIGFIEAIKGHFEKYKLTITKDVLSPNMLLKDFVTKAGIGETVLLIDEYDYPLTHPQDNLTKGEFEFFSNEVLAIMRNFYATIKNDLGEYFRKIFITGITRYKDASIFTDGNTITDISLDPTFGAIVGFTRNEIKYYFYEHLRYAAMQHYAVNEKDINDEHIEQILDKLAYWYDGFCFDELNMHHVFSTISILSFLSNRYSLFKQYWYELGGVPSILRLNAKRLITYYLNNKNLETNISKTEFISPNFYNSMHEAVLLYQSGYLTLAEAIDYANPFYKVKLKLPNYEIQSSIEALYYSLIYKDKYYDLETNIFNFSMSQDELLLILNKIYNCVDHEHYAIDQESLSIIPIQMYFKGNGYNVQVNSHTRLGKADLCIALDNSHYFIFEYKFNFKNRLQDDLLLLEEAIAQMQTKEYDKIIDVKVRSFACVFNEEQRQISAFKELI